MGTIKPTDRERTSSITNVTEQGEVRIVSFQRNDTGVVVFEQVRTYFASSMLEHTHGWNRLVIDLTGVPALDSAALGPLVQKLREVQEAKGRLVLTGIEAPALREIFALTRFDRVFEIAPGRTEAVAQAAG